MNPIELFEAYLGCSISEHLTNEQFSDKIKALDEKFNWLEVYIHEYGEDGSPITDVDVSEDKNIKDLHFTVDGLVGDLIESLKSITQDIIINYDTYEDIFFNHFWSGDKLFKIGMSICKYYKIEGFFNENHMLLAKNDKKTFESLFLSLYSKA